MLIMLTSLLVRIINWFSLVISVAQLCVASSIFDFIVVNRMYHAVSPNNDGTLIDPQYATVFFGCPLISAAIALWSIVVPNMPTSIQAFISRHTFLVAVAHGILLGVASIAFALCSLTSAQLSQGVGYYAYHGVPQPFQDASLWYFVRLRAGTVLFGIQSLLALSQIGVLYVGSKCRYRTIYHCKPEEKECCCGGGEIKGAIRKEMRNKMFWKTTWLTLAILFVALAALSTVEAKHGSHEGWGGRGWRDIEGGGPRGARVAWWGKSKSGSGSWGKSGSWGRG